MEDAELKKLKQDYEKLRKRYNLPSFKELNQEFVLEELQAVQTEILAKKIRMLILRKVVDILNVLERFANPTQASWLIMSIAEKLSHEDRSLFDHLYSELGKLELEAWKLESEPYSEEKEVLFIKKALKKLKELQPKLSKFSSRACELYRASLKK